MKIFKNLFSKHKGDGGGKEQSSGDNKSIIEKIKEFNSQGYAHMPDSNSDIFDSGSEMTEKEYMEAVDALFPVRLTDFMEAIKSGEDPFPVKTSMVKGDVPTMDAATGGTGGAGKAGAPSAPRVGGSVPGAVGKAVQRAYPPMPNRQGYYAGLEGGGFSMLPDPLLRFPINPRVLKHFQSRIWITYTGCAVIATHEIVNRACAIPAEDAIAHGYKVVCASPEHQRNSEHDTAEAQFLVDVKKAADKMGLNEACVRLDYKKKVFGVGIAIPWVEFKEDYMSPTGKDKGIKYSYADEYDPKAIKKGSFKGFAVVDPHWLTYQWDQESRTDPSSPHFLEPTWIKVKNKRIHRSWIIRVVNSELPDIFKPVYLYGGLSLTQMIYERVWCADKLANEAPLLAMTKRLLIADGNLDQMIADSRHTNKFFNAINYFRDNFSIFVKKPSSNVTQLDTSLSELTPLTMSQYQLVAAIAQIPVTKLLKNVPSGLQATGQYEWDDYAQSLKAIQTNEYGPLCRMFFELYCASNYPEKEDMRLDVEWNPIDVPDEKEVAQMSSQTAQYVSHLINTGLITIAEGRAILRKTNLPAFQSIPTEVPDLLKKIEESKDPSKQMAGMPGGLGQPIEGAVPQGTDTEPTPQLSPEVQKNDAAFKDAIKQFLISEGVEEEPAPETQATPQGEEMPQGDEPRQSEEPQ